MGVASSIEVGCWLGVRCSTILEAFVLCCRAFCSSAGTLEAGFWFVSYASFDCGCMLHVCVEAVCGLKSRACHIT